MRMFSDDNVTTCTASTTRTKTCASRCKHTHKAVGLFFFFFVEFDPNQDFVVLIVAPLNSSPFERTVDYRFGPQTIAYDNNGHK